MAGFAGDAAVDVASRLATGGLAVVTASAIVLDRGMVEHRIIPAECPMTIAAVVPGLNVIRALARGGTAVVATLATALDSKVIHFRNIDPAVALMAELTVPGGLDVIGRGLGSLYSATARMTAAALFRCARENAIHMAALAIDLGMTKIQREGGIVMVELLLGLGHADPREHKQ